MIKKELLEADAIRNQNEKLYVIYLKILAAAAANDGLIAGGKKKDISEFSDFICESKEEVELVIGTLRQFGLVKVKPEGYVMDIQDKSEEKKPAVRTDYSFFVDLWNNTAGTVKVKILSDKRKHSINARIKEYGEEKVAETIKSIEQSDFFKYRWHPSFDWFLKPNNFLKVAEGNYINNAEKSYGEEF